jgi:rare lipoprotein A
MKVDVLCAGIVDLQDVVDDMFNNKNITLLLKIICLLFFLSSCASIPPEVYPPEADYVTASWYGPKFHGRPTASGERFNMYALTAAHREFPFGTRLRVTNPENNKSVVVTINDRGPFVPGRELDLSYAAAKEIGLIDKGVGRVRIEYLGRDIRYVKRVAFITPASSVPLTIQIGSFTKASNAYRLKQGLEIKYSNVYITTFYLKGQKYYRVRIGEFYDRNNAYSFAERLAQEGYSTFITSKD